MMKKIIKILIITNILYFVSSDFPPACMQMLNKNLFLFECCEYPVIPQDPSIYDKCLNECNTFDYCCYQECSARESGAYINNSLNPEMIKSIFVMQKGFGKYMNLTEKWIKVVNGTVDRCSAVSRPSDQKACEYIYEVVACIFKENFINCPHMDEKTICKEIKSDMEDCGNNEGSWRFITDAFNTVRPRTYARRYAANIGKNLTN